MLVEQQDVFYYVTLMNENYANPDLPTGAAEGVIRGGYRFPTYGAGAAQLTLLGSGAILTEVIRAAEELALEDIASEVVSVTSCSELARDSLHASELLAGAGPVVAASDYVRAVPEQIRALVPDGRRY